MRAYSIVACVSTSGRNYRRLPFLRTSINFFPDILSSSVCPRSRTRSSPCSFCPGRTALHLLSLDIRRCADDGKFVPQLGLQLTSVHPSLLAGILRIVSFDSSNRSIGLLIRLDSFACILSLMASKIFLRLNHSPLNLIHLLPDYHELRLHIRQLSWRLSGLCVFRILDLSLNWLLFETCSLVVTCPL